MKPQPDRYPWKVGDTYAVLDHGTTIHTTKIVHLTATQVVTQIDNTSPQERWNRHNGRLRTTGTYRSRYLRPLGLETP